MNADINKWSSPTYQEFHKIIKEEIAPIVNQVDARVQNFKNHFVKEAAKFIRDFKSLAKKADESLDKISVLEKENEHLLRAVVSQDIMSIVLNPIVVESSNLQTELQHMKERVPPKVVETNDLSNPVTSNSVPTTNESHVMKNDKVIASGMFRINPFKTFKKDKFVPINRDRARVDITTKTRRPQTRSNTKNDRVPSTSKSSCIKNNEVEVEDHHRKLLLSKNKKHMSSECNNIKLAIRNDKSKVVYAIPMRVESINGKRYVLVIIDGYSRYTWVHFLKSKDEAPEEIKTFLKKIQVLLQAPVIIQNGFVEQRNRTLVEDARTMLIFVVLRSAYGLKRLLLRALKTASLFTANDREDIGKLGAKGDIGFFIGYFANSCAYRVYNRMTRKIMETMNVIFDELSAMDFEQHTDTRTATAAPVPQVLQTLTTSTTTIDTSPTTANSSSQAADTPSTL
ncbi:retrovirus-related pol polyprotein from transposon TNT 1-94 [Tanacetum coccineum]